MNKQVDIRKLLLPVPGRLVPQVEAGASKILRPEALVEFLSAGLKDGGAIEVWVGEQTSIMADLLPLAAQEKLSPREEIYDRYFGVGRHGGANASVMLALGQILGELSRELQVGASLGTPDMNRLFDGLAAVSEVVSEC